MNTIKKTRATARGCNPFSNELSCRVGGKPVSFVESQGRFKFSDWQNDAYRTLHAAFFGILNSPTGSGKSVVQKALALALMRKGEKVIIAVPDTSVAGSFLSDSEDARKFWLPEGSALDWMVPPDNFLFDNNGVPSKDNVRKLMDFVKIPKGTMSGRIMVCTHAALVRAHQEMMRAHTGKGSPWRGVNLFIDEAHHSKCMDDATDAEMTLSNELGKLVGHYVKNRPGRLLLTTATWLRGDAMTIVPEADLSAFKDGLYEFPIDAYLDSLEHLKTISFKFTVVDTFEDALEEVTEDPRKKTIVYLPPVKAGEGSSAKLERLRLFRRALGSSKITDGGFTRTHSSGVVSMDLVTEEGRPAVQTFFQENKARPDCVFVQNLFREGSDWRQAERSIVMGPRGSLPMVIQMIGRLTRDFEGKEKVTFQVVLPKAISLDDDSFRMYTGAIFMTMALGWQFTVGLKIPARLRTQSVLKALMNECREETMREPTLGESPGETMRRVFENALGEKLSDEEAEEVTKSLLDCVSGSFRVAASAAKAHMTASEAQALEEAISTDPLHAGAAGIFEVNWGKKTFREFREGYVGLPEITPQYVDQQIFLHRCIYFKKKGQYVDPRTIGGAVELFGSKAALDKACLTEGLGSLGQKSGPPEDGSAPTHMNMGRDRLFRMGRSGST